MRCLFLIFVLCLVAMPAAGRGPVCGERQGLVDQLASKYAEYPEDWGLAANGSILETIVSADGSWTILVTTPQGVTCLIAAGEHWGKSEFKPNQKKDPET